MTDKERIRKEVERLRSLHQMKYQQLDADNSMSLVECGKRNLCNELLSFIDSLQEEPAKIKKGCKYLCLGDMFNNDTGKIGFIGGKIYLAPEDNTLVSEENGWRCDTSENASNFELVEEPVSIWHDASEKPEHDDLLIETNDGRIIHRQSINNYGMAKRWAYTSDLLNLNNSCNLKNNSQEEPVSEDLGDYINELSKQFPEVSFAKLSRIAVRVAKWQKGNIWKPADGDDLPEIDREVIVLLNNGRVAFGHRPPEYWDGKDIITGKVTRNYVERYDKGLWNIPNVKYWLDVNLPKQED